MSTTAPPGLSCQSDTAKKIGALCHQWVQATHKPGGGFAIGAASDQHRLHRNGIRFETLCYCEVQAACTGLSRVLLLKGLNTIIDLDHQLLWAWAGEVLLAPPATFFSQDEHELKRLFETAIRASLAGIAPPPRSREEWEAQTQRRRQVEFNTQQLTLSAHLVLSYLALPLLEGLLKKVCKQYVDYSGRVLTAFQVPAAKGLRDYVPKDPRRGWCSSLRDLMFLLHRVVADDDLRGRIDEMRAFLAGLDASVDPFDQLYAWRNESLHGETSYPTIGGTVINLAIVIALNQLRKDYETHRANAWANVQRETQTFQFSRSRSPWSFYPPF